MFKPVQMDSVFTIVFVFAVAVPLNSLDSPETVVQSRPLKNYALYIWFIRIL